MEVTEVRIRVVQEEGQEKLRAFATVTLDACFVIREVKVIEGDRGLFVAMPSRKAMDRCRECGARNAVGSNFCNACGRRLPRSTQTPTRSREKMYLDVAHPVNSDCRRMIHEAVIGEYQRELEAGRAAQQSREREGAHPPPPRQEQPKPPEGPQAREEPHEPEPPQAPQASEGPEAPQTGDEPSEGEDTPEAQSEAEPEAEPSEGQDTPEDHTEGPAASDKPDNKDSDDFDKGIFA